MPRLGDKAFGLNSACTPAPVEKHCPSFQVVIGQIMVAQFFAAAVVELSALQLPHWLMFAGGVLVVVGAIGVLVSGRTRAGAPPEPDREDLPPELQKEEPNS
jgi:hypothetical protein